jgi:hypothetical protein
MKQHINMIHSTSRENECYIGYSSSQKGTHSLIRHIHVTKRHITNGQQNIRVAQTSPDIALSNHTSTIFGGGAFRSTYRSRARTSYHPFQNRRRYVHKLVESSSRTHKSCLVCTSANPTFRSDPSLSRVYRSPSRRDTHYAAMVESNGLAALRMSRTCKQHYKRQLHDFQVPYRDIEGLAQHDPPIFSTSYGSPRCRAGTLLLVSRHFQSHLVKICIPTRFDLVTLADLVPNLGIASHPLHTYVLSVEANDGLTLL